MEDKRRKYYGYLWKGQRKIELHIFYLAPEGKSQYQPGLSLHYFNKREGTLFLEATRGRREHAPYRTHVKSQADYEIDLKTAKYMLEKHNFKEPDLPTFEHDSIWDFYAAIGYDRKLKRYTRE